MKPGDKVQSERLNDLVQTTELDKKKTPMAPRWAAILGMLAIGVLYAALPSKLKIGPDWLLLVIEAVFLIPLLASFIWSERKFSHRTIRTLIIILLGIITLAEAIGIALLIVTLPNDKRAADLLRSAALLWSFNVLVFALWYWEIDGGGPMQRHMSGHKAADFMFPQQADGDPGGWAPHFLDYVFLAFTGATALSPADTLPLTRQAKVLMMMEAVLSLTIIVLLAARAVNILGS